MLPGVFSTFLLLVLMASVTMSQNNEQQLALNEVANANTAFTSSLYSALKTESPGNLIFSPYSLSAVMAMVRAGARGATASDIDKTLKFPDTVTLNKGYKALIESLKSDGDQFTLETANRVYAQAGFDLNEEFKNTLKTYYNAEPIQLNFAKAEASAKTINDFVSTTTHDKIKDLVSASDFDSLTRMVLVNAIYFKGLWKNKFDPALTSKKPFFVTPNNSVEVDMMKLEADLPYGEIEELDAKVVSLPYKGDRLSMLVLLPQDKDGLPALEQKLKNFPLSSIPEKLRERKVALSMPRFRLESTIDLKVPLSNLGLSSIFDSTKADFTGIPADGKTPLFVSKAVQKAFIEVNEEGSEAAAATGLTIMLKSAIQNNRFVLNRPFVAAIYDNRTMSVLFFNTLSDPTMEKTRIGTASKSSSANLNSPLPSFITSLTMTMAIIFWSLGSFSNNILRQPL